MHNVTHSGLDFLTKGDLQKFIKKFPASNFVISGNSFNGHITVSFGNTYFIHFDKETHNFVQAHKHLDDTEARDEFSIRVNLSAKFSFDHVLSEILKEIISYTSQKFNVD